MERRCVPPFVGGGDENGGTIHNPPLNVAFLLLVDDQEVVGVQFDGVSHRDRLNLQPVVEQLLWSSSEQAGQYLHSLCTHTLHYVRLQCVWLSHIWQRRVQPLSGVTTEPTLTLVHSPSYRLCTSPPGTGSGRPRSGEGTLCRPERCRP